MGRAATIFCNRLTAPHVEWRETAWQQKMGWICFHLRFALLNPQMCLSGATSFAIIPGNVACVSQLISVRTSKHKWYKFCKHSRYIYILHSRFFHQINMLTLDCKLKRLFYKCFSSSIQLPSSKINVSLASFRVTMSHPVTIKKLKLHFSE